MLKRKDVTSILNNPLGKEKTQRQFEVVTGCPHNRRKAAVLDTHLKGLFDCQMVFTLIAVTLLPAHNIGLHHSLWIKLRAPGIRKCHVRTSSLKVNASYHTYSKHTNFRSSRLSNACFTFSLSRPSACSPTLITVLISSLISPFIINAS